MPRPIAGSTLVTTDTGEASLIVGGTPEGTTGTGGQVTGPIALADRVPADQSFKIVNNAGTLQWNGIVVATGSSVSGTTGKLAKFTAPNALGNSIVSESGAVATVTGTMNATADVQLNGASINTGGTLPNVAYKDQANTFANASGQAFSAGIGLDGGAPSTHGIMMPSAVPGSTTTNLHNNAGTLKWDGSILAGANVSDSVGSMATLRASIPATVIVDMVGGRLTLESGVAVSTTDQNAKTTLYYTPYVSNLISLYNGSSAWASLAFTELSITLAGLTASKPYDVFCYNNSGTATLELLVWTSTTARATALVRQDGRWVKSGATTRRYLGTIYINSSGGQCDDSFAFRYVWNANNRVVRPMRRVETTASWTWATAVWHQANASTANQLDFVIGLPDVCVHAVCLSIASVITGGVQGWCNSIGLDSTSPATGVQGAWTGVTLQENYSPSTAALTTYPGIGRHYLTWLEHGDGGTTTFCGYSAATNNPSETGISGILEG